MKRTILFGSITVILVLLTGVVQAAQIYTGSFVAGSLYGNGNAAGSGPYAGNSDALVTDFLAKQAAVKAGTNTATHLYADASQMSMWGDLQSTPATYTDAVANGGCFYFGTVITGLSATDFVHISGTASYKSPGSSSYTTYGSLDYYYDIGTYSRINDGTISGEVTKIIQEPDTSFTFYTTGQIFKDWTWNNGSPRQDYWPTDEEFESLIGFDFKFDEIIEIYSGGTLGSPTVNPRGYTTGTSLSGGSLTLSDAFTGYGTVIPEPTTIVLFLLSFIGIAVKKIKK